MKKPEPIMILLAAGVTVAFTIAVFFTLLSIAKTQYASTHELKLFEHSFLGFRWVTQQEVTIGMLRTPVVLFAIVLPTIVYGIMHPIIGRVIATLSQELSNELASVLGAESGFGNWSGEKFIVNAMFWPATMFLIPCKLIALLFCHLYNSMWK